MAYLKIGHWTIGKPVAECQCNATDQEWCKCFDVPTLADLAKLVGVGLTATVVVRLLLS